MREADRDPGRIEDVLKAADNVMSFIKGRTYESFAADKMCYYAVLKNLEIIGEASYMLTKEFRECHSEIPWNSIIKMRHILVHGYATVLPEIIWHTATEDVPQLVMSINAISLRDPTIQSKTPGQTPLPPK